MFKLHRHLYSIDVRLCSISNFRQCYSVLLEQLEQTKVFLLILDSTAPEGYTTKQVKWLSEVCCV